MLVALFFSMLLGLGIGILANRSDLAERIIIPLLDIFQTLPILAFFPVVIYVVVATLPGYIGINAAVIFLIVTSMVWNIAFGAYEAIKSLPVEFVEVSRVFRLGAMEKLLKVDIPAAMPRVVDQSMLSWAVGLFYLVTSEIFSTGSKSYTVTYGIGVALTQLASRGNVLDYVVGIVVFIAFVVVTRFLLFGYLERRFIKRSGRAAQQPNILSRILLHQTLVDAASKRISGFGREVGRIAQQGPGAAKKKRAFAASGARRATPAISRLSASRFYHAAVLIAVVAVVLLLVTNQGIRNDEYLVLVALALSIARIWLAFAVVLLVAFPLGVYIVFLTRKGTAYLTLFQIIASIPATILLPAIAFSLRGQSFSGELVAFIVFFLSGIWYVVFGIVSSRGTIQENVMEVKKVFGVRGAKAWRYIYSKAVLPGLITGGITAVAAEWNASIVAEWFTTSGVSNGTVITSVGNGLGRLLDLSLANGNLTLMIIGLINLTAVIIIVNRLFWKRAYRKVMQVYK